MKGWLFWGIPLIGMLFAASSVPAQAPAQPPLGPITVTTSYIDSDMLRDRSKAVNLAVVRIDDRLETELTPLVQQIKLLGEKLEALQGQRDKFLNDPEGMQKLYDQHEKLSREIKAKVENVEERYETRKAELEGELLQELDRGVNAYIAARQVKDFRVANTLDQASYRQNGALDVTADFIAFYDDWSASRPNR